MDKDKILEMQHELDRRLRDVYTDFMKAHFKQNDGGTFSLEDSILGLKLLEPVLKMALFFCRERKAELFIEQSSLSEEEKKEAFHNLTIKMSRELLYSIMELKEKDKEVNDFISSLIDDQKRGLIR